MQKHLKAVSRLSALVLTVGLAAGCATTDQINSLTTTANNALSEARSAMSAAGAAQSTADRALAAANSASAAASQAQQSAGSALSCCNDNSDKIERMFERAMRK